jgi:hypothetical protein
VQQLQQAAQLRQQWRLEVVLEVLQVVLAAASRAAEGQCLFLSPEAAQHRYRHQEHPHEPRLDLNLRPQPNF